MWLALNDESHCRECCGVTASLRGVLSAIRELPNAARAFGHWSLNVFLITGSQYSESAANAPDLASVEYDQQSGLILVGFGESTEKWGQWKEHGYWVRVGKWAYCDERQAVDLVDRILAQAFSADDLPGQGGGPLKHAIRNSAGMVERWRGHHARIVELTKSHTSLRIIVGDRTYGENLLITCLGPLHIKAPIEWDNSAIVLKPTPLASGTEGVALIDEPNTVRVVAESVEVAENVRW